MKNRILSITFLTLTSSLGVGYMSYGSDLARPPSQRKVIDETIRAKEGSGERMEKRKEARELQNKGETLRKSIGDTTKPLSQSGTVLGIVASASGDPHAKMAAAAFRISIMAIDGLGKGIADIVIGVGRYQERSQEILSNAEALLEDLQKSLEKKESLEKKLQELINVDKLPEPSQSSSTLKKFATSASNALQIAKIKARQATDVFTNEKTKREEKIKEIQIDLKAANENHEENIRLLQILLMQDTIKEIDKKINIEDTIAQLASDATFYQNARENLSKNKSKQKKQLAEIVKREAQTNKELIYYSEFQKNPTQTVQELEKDRSGLVDKINELTALTKRGDTIYLQQRDGDVQLDSQMNRAAIIAVLKEIDALKSQLKALTNSLLTKGASVVAPLPPKNDNTSQSKALATPPRPSSPFGEKAIRVQREALRKTNQ